MRVKDLIPWDKNPRINDDAAKKLASYIERDGWGAPILVQAGTNRIIAGHTRTKAAKLLGMDRVPVRIIECDDRQATRLALADNKLGEQARWDDDALLSLLDEVGLADAELMGWDSSELDKLAAQLDPGDIEEDEVPEAPKTPVTKPGDVWTLGRHTVVCGDALSFDWPSCDGVFTDPPYGVSYSGAAGSIANDESADVGVAAVRLCLDAVRPGGSVYVCATPAAPGIEFWRALIELGVFRSRCVWAKDRLTMSNSDYQPRYEDIYYGWKPGASHTWLSDRKQSTVWEFDRPSRSAEHPTMKPVALVAYAVRNSFPKQSTVCDPFLGSGTTLIACEQLDRVCVGTEIDPGYCDVIVERWENLTGEKAVRNGASI